MKKIVVILTLCFISVSMFAQTTETTTVTEDKTSIFGNIQLAMSERDYQVTAGDVYSLNYAAGSSTVSYKIPVDSTYKIRVSNLAVIDASGLTYLELKKQVEEIVTRNYPLSGVQFVLETAATFKVTVKGEIADTTEVLAWPLSRLSSVVNTLFNSYSSKRDITITSLNGKSRNYDLFKAARFGDLSNDPYLRPGDVITINRVQRVVSVSGAVERPGTYQLLEGENLDKLINYYASGLTVSADPSRIEITKIKTENSVSGEKIYLDKVCKDDEFALSNHDSVFITTYSDLKPVMFMEGAVGSLASSTSLNTSTHMPVQFELGTNYGYFIRQNASLFKSSVSDNANAYIIRGDQIIPIDINSILYTTDFDTDLLVQADDILMVPFKQYFVTVAGAVRAPGRYPYIPDRSWDYYIGLAGGFIKNENKFDAVIITDLNGRKHSKKEAITPESCIVAQSNSLAYFVNQYGTLIASISTLISAVIDLITLTRNLPNKL